MGHPEEGPRLLHLDVHEAALGHTHLDLRYLLIGPDADPAPPPGESPEARWCSWDEAAGLADEALGLGAADRPGGMGGRRVGPAMSGALDQLLVVQDLDTAITQLTPARRPAERSGLTGLEVELAGYAAEQVALMGRRAELMATQKDLEGQIAVVTERRTGIEQRMYAARGSSTRDLQAMDEEVRHLTQRQSELEEGSWWPWSTRNRSTPSWPTWPNGAPRSKNWSPCCGPRWSRGRPRSTRSWPKPYRPGPRGGRSRRALADRYEKLRARMRGVGAARLIGHRCDGCHLELSAVEVDRIRACPPTPLSPATCAGASWSRPDLTAELIHPCSSWSATGSRPPTRRAVARAHRRQPDREGAGPGGVGAALLPGPVTRCVPAHWLGPDTAALLDLDLPRGLTIAGSRSTTASTKASRFATSRPKCGRMAADPGLALRGRDPDRGRRPHRRGLRRLSATRGTGARSTDGDVVVVSHVTPIKAAVAWALGAGAGLSWRLHLHTASVTRIGWGNDGPVLESFNQLTSDRGDAPQSPRA